MLGSIPVFLAQYGIDVAPVLITTAINNAAARQLPAIKLITRLATGL